MAVYYFYFVPIKDKHIEVIDDPSLNGIRMNLHLFQSIRKHITEDDQYVLLKSIDDLHITFDKTKFVSNLENFATSSPEDVMTTLLKCFELNGSTYEKYLGIAQYPLLVIKPRRKKAVLHSPKTTLDVLNHCFLHIYQFLHVKQLTEECEKANSVLQINNLRYKPAINSAARFVTCCAHNIVIEVSTKRFYILKHDCLKSKYSWGKFDNNIYQVVRQMLT